jgi:hypothetical protein
MIAAPVDNPHFVIGIPPLPDLVDNGTNISSLARQAVAADDGCAGICV